MCVADTKFAFKAFQKDNPVAILSSIFVATCVGFGLSLRIFERYYWESKFVDKQNWDYVWNSMWCVFVSMATGIDKAKLVGYGDFYPCTQMGRLVCIIGCMIGIYFVSTLMVFMTQKSVLSENEYKSFKLITRLHAKKCRKNEFSNIIYHCMMMKIQKDLFMDNKTNIEQFNIAYKREKRHIYDSLNQLNSHETSYDLSAHDRLFEICNHVEQDIKDLEKEISNIKGTYYHPSS
jgi:hypothetical protein